MLTLIYRPALEDAGVIVRADRTGSGDCFLAARCSHVCVTSHKETVSHHRRGRGY